MDFKAMLESARRESIRNNAKQSLESQKGNSFGITSTSKSKSKPEAEAKSEKEEDEEEEEEKGKRNEERKERKIKETRVVIWSPAAP